ncbi:MAG: methyltransferase domain-containing protein [Chloroflexota bacterium]
MTDVGDGRMSSQGATDAFAQQAACYDAWYDGALGRAVFWEEMSALRPLLEGLSHPWLEIGVGSGRFAADLRLDVGIDPVEPPLALAARRGLTVVQALGEALPFPPASFGAVLFITSLCFIADQRQALREARRALASGGRVVLGLIPGEGPWGRHYRALAAGGDPFYRRAHFFARSELSSLLASAGLRPVRTRSALFWPPTGEPAVTPAREGDDLSAGFIAVAAEADKSA